MCTRFILYISLGPSHASHTFTYIHHIHHTCAHAPQHMQIGVHILTWHMYTHKKKTLESVAVGFLNNKFFFLTLNYII